MLQLGFHSAILPDLSLADLFQTASDIGYECIEVMCWPPGQAERRYAGVSHFDTTSTDPKVTAEIRETIDRTGVQISSLGYYPNLLEERGKNASTHADHLRRLMDLSAELGINKVTTFVGRDHTLSVDDNWPIFLDVWNPLIEYAEKVGVDVGIENCPMLFTADEWPGGKNLACTPAIWRRMFSDIPSPRFGLNYDPSHFVFMQMDPVRPLIEFADRLHHVHAKDVRVDPDKLNDVGVLAYPNEYHQPKLPGLGQVDWSNFFATLTSIGYEGPVCVEVEDRAYEQSDDARRKSLVQCHHYLRNFIPRSN